MILYAVNALTNHSSNHRYCIRGGFRKILGQRLLPPTLLFLFISLTLSRPILIASSQPPLNQGAQCLWVQVHSSKPVQALRQGILCAPE